MVLFCPCYILCSVLSDSILSVVFCPWHIVNGSVLSVSFCSVQVYSECMHWFTAAVFTGLLYALVPVPHSSGIGVSVCGISSGKQQLHRSSHAYMRATPTHATHAIPCNWAPSRCRRHRLFGVLVRPVGHLAKGAKCIPGACFAIHEPRY